MLICFIYLKYVFDDAAHVELMHVLFENIVVDITNRFFYVNINLIGMVFVPLFVYAAIYIFEIWFFFVLFAEKGRRADEDGFVPFANVEI